MRSFLYRNFVYNPVVALQAGQLGPCRRRLQESQYWDREIIHRHQLTLLRGLIDHAARYVPAYSQTLGAIEPLRNLDDLRTLPFLSKAQIQANAACHLSENVRGRLVKKTTGGSIGQPVTIWKTRDAWLSELAATWRGYSWAGVGPGDAQLRFWGVPFQPRDRRQAALTDWICHRRRCSAFAFTESDLNRYVQVARKFRPRYFYGYVSMLDAFADHVARHHPSLQLGLSCIITTSEVLTPSIRRRLEGVFQTKVFDEYGCGELGTIAHECPAGFLHLTEENMIVEICDGDRQCAPGEPGELVVTELHNRAMPLIRYRTGDFGTLSSQPCSCGRTLTVLQGLHGRAYDMVRNRAGERFHGEFMMYIFEEIKRQGGGIRQFQVIQESLDTFCVRIVPDAGFGRAHEELIVTRIRDHVDPAAQVRFEIVGEIERSPSGKMRLIVGLMDGPDLHDQGNG